MITLTPTQTQYLTLDELNALISNSGEPPADMRERLRELVHRLPDVARAVYNRENIRNNATPLLTVIETVVYHFDRDNREAVAFRLGLSYTEMMFLLIGYLLGQGE